MATTRAWVNIYPYPLTNLTVTDGTTTITYPHADLIASSDHYELTIGTGYTLGCSDLTFSADGYQPITKSCYTDTTHTVTLEALPSKPEYLYAYTNNDVIINTYYCWRNETYSNSIYTLTAQPTESDDLYIKDSTTGDFEIASTNVIESVAEDYSYINDSQLGARSKHNRYSEGDETVSTSDSPLILYTDSTILTTGMTLYDNTGTDTGYKVGEISGDSFDIQTNVSVNFVRDTTTVMGVASYTIDDIEYTSDQTVSLSIGVHTLSATPMAYYSSRSLLINDEQVGYDSCSFTVSDSQIVFGNNAYVGTPADTFVIKLSAGSN